VEPRICLVTGASKGIGRAVAERLSADGHRVVLLSRNQAELDDVAASLPGPTLTVAADVTRPDQIERAFAEIEARWGAVEVLVCSAGAGYAAPLVSTTDEDWQRMLDLNLTAPFRCIRRALPAMIEARWGRVVVVASVAAKRGENLISAYTASKHGVLGLVRAAATEVARNGVTVNAVCPAYVDTPMTDTTIREISERSGRSLEEAATALARRQPIGRLIDAAEVAEAVHFCIVNAGVTGQGINVDGGSVQS
jgi:NAD(P)-dependent dehydrogenase (short-subunit alcohol dehydrogenase family)